MRALVLAPVQNMKILDTQQYDRGVWSSWCHCRHLAPSQESSMSLAVVVTHSPALAQSQNMRCRDMEWEIPIPPVKGSNTRDHTVIQRAWWDAITLHYQRADAPMRVALEMRLTGSSQILLAPQLNNTLGTISIEVLTTPITPEAAWRSFMQQVTDQWTSYRSPNGEYLNARPHWAKEWQGLMVRGKPIESYLRKSAYKDQRKEFVKILEEVIKKRGGTLEETRKRFGNPLLERLFFE